MPKTGGFVWGSEETKFFFELTPDRILNSVEEAGFRCTGRVQELNSMENRVYDVELEEGTTSLPDDARTARSRIIKFYRPGRWSKGQILEEHEFLKDLSENEVPVVPPLAFKTGETVREVKGLTIYYSIFPKVRGRAPQELNNENLKVVGRLLARLHQVGARKRAKHRIEINPTSYGRDNLNHILQTRLVPDHFRDRYQSVVEKICEAGDPIFKSCETIRIHGDCHLGNLLWGSEGPFFLDFDDMLRGPPVQDMWLIVAGRDAEALEQREILLSAYEEMRTFDRSTLQLIEILRALRFIHFSAWIGKRWQDPAFPKHFPHFGSERYWEEQVTDLYEQWELIQTASGG